MDTTQHPVELGELRARLQPALLLAIQELPLPTGSLQPGDLVMAQYWGNGAVMLYPVDPQRQPASLWFTHDLEASNVRVVSDYDNDSEGMFPGELRARLQPMLMLRILQSVKSQNGHLRFAAGDLVMAQFWGGGAVVLHPVRLKDQPAGWFFTHDLEDSVALAELELKGSTPAEYTPPGYLS